MAQNNDSDIKYDRYERVVSVCHYKFERYTILEADIEKGFRITEYDRITGEIKRDDRY